jgi:hypothetical protein
MARRALPRRVELIRILQKGLHTLTIFNKHVGNVSFRVFRFAEPPYRVNGIFSPYLSLVDPFNGAGQFGRIKPVEVFCQIKA